MKPAVLEVEANLMTVEAAGLALGVSEPMIRKWMREEQLTVRIGRCVRVRACEVARVQRDGWAPR